MHDVTVYNHDTNAPTEMLLFSGDKLSQIKEKYTFLVDILFSTFNDGSTENLKEIIILRYMLTDVNSIYDDRRTKRTEKLS